MATPADTVTKNLLDTASYLNDRLSIGTDTTLAQKVNEKKNSIESQKVVLQDLRDAIETYNREFIERDNEMIQKPKNFLNNTQDYSLFIMFVGYGVFCLGILVYIMIYSKRATLLSMIFVVLAVLLYTLFVFMVQRFG
jgi:ABC-type multidrug transport system fused ATPase/permease subunit